MSKFPQTPPEGCTPRPWTFPATESAVLPNGLQVLAVRMPALPIVHVRWSFRTGRVLEPEDRIGVARMLATVARHGTSRFDSAGLADALDSLGARLHVAVAPDNTVVGVSALSHHVDQAFDLAEEVTFRPTFPPDAVARERVKALEMYRHERSQPEQLAGRWLARALYGAHPYGRPAATAQGLDTVDAEALAKLHRQIVQRSSGLLLVVGDVDPEKIVLWAAERYGGHEPPSDPNPEVPHASTRGERRVIVVDRPGSEQISIAFGMLVPARKHADFMPLRLVNQVLGGGASARLFMELRERRSLTYGAYSALDVGRLGGDLTATLACAPPKAPEAVSTLLSELGRIGTEVIDADELDHARRYLIGSFPQRASGVSGVAALVNAAWLHDLPDGVWSRYQADIGAIDAETVGEVAARWLRPDDGVLVVVGEREAALEAIAHDDTALVFDASDTSYEFAPTT